MFDRNSIHRLMGLGPSFCLLSAVLGLAAAPGIAVARPAERPAETGPLRIEADHTLSTLIGGRIHDRAGQAVGIVADLWFDRAGAATTVVVQDGGFFGYPDDLVALPYLSVFATGPRGDSLKSIGPAAKHLARPGAVPDAGTLAATGLLHAGLYSPDNQRLADAEDFTIQNGHLAQVMFAFNVATDRSRLLAIPYSELSVHRYGTSEIRLVLTPAQAASLESYKNRAP